jgi:curved DNA-binding protein
MPFKDYYATLGVSPTATHDEIRRAYRKLARKYHPDVSKEPNAEARFKEVAEAHEAVTDPERRATYDAIAKRHAQGEDFDTPPDWGSGFDSAGRAHNPNDGARQRRGPHPAGDAEDFSAFFASIFGRGGPAGMHRASADTESMQGRDHHAKVAIALLDAVLGASRMITLRMPTQDAAGNPALQERQLEVNIPKGVRNGQHLRLAGLGAAGFGGAPEGDLYLEIDILPHPVFRLDGGDISFDLPITPWEAALGASVTAPTPAGHVQLTVPAGSAQGRKLRLKGKGLPGKVPGDLYAVLQVAVPPCASDSERAAYSALANAFPNYHPRANLEAK